MEDMRGLMYDEYEENLYLVLTTDTYAGNWITEIAKIDYKRLEGYFDIEFIQGLTESDLYFIAEHYDILENWELIDQYDSKREAMITHAFICNFYVA